MSCLNSEQELGSGWGRLCPGLDVRADDSDASVQASREDSWQVSLPEQLASPSGPARSLQRESAAVDTKYETSAFFGHPGVEVCRFFVVLAVIAISGGVDVSSQEAIMSPVGSVIRND